VDGIQLCRAEKRLEIGTYIAQKSSIEHMSAITITVECKSMHPQLGGECHPRTDYVAEVGVYL
jgi:hypothetical protein